MRPHQERDPEPNEQRQPAGRAPRRQPEARPPPGRGQEPPQGSQQQPPPEGGWQRQPQGQQQQTGWGQQQPTAWEQQQPAPQQGQQPPQAPPSGGGHQTQGQGMSYAAEQTQAVPPAGQQAPRGQQAPGGQRGRERGRGQGARGQRQSPQMEQGREQEQGQGQRPSDRPRLSPVTVEEVVQTDVVTAEPDTPIATVVAEMAEEEVGSVVVVDERVPIGILTDRLIALTLETDPDVTDRNAEDLLEGALVTGDTDMTLFDAVERMREEGIRRLPIVDEDRSLQGIVTLDDVLVVLSEAFQRAAGVIEEQSPRY